MTKSKSGEHSLLKMAKMLLLTKNRRVGGADKTHYNLKVLLCRGSIPLTSNFTE